MFLLSPAALAAKPCTEKRAVTKRMQTDLRATTVYVTHDQLEAMSMGDRIAIMYKGLLQQDGTPTVVYDLPNNLFVAGFIGSPSMYFLTRIKTDWHINVQGQDGAASTVLGVTAANRFAGAPNATELVLGVRPEDVHLLEAPTSESLQAKVVVVELLGSENIINIEIAGHVVKVRTGPTFRPYVGDVLNVRIDQSRSHLFNTETTDRYVTPEG